MMFLEKPLSSNIFLIQSVIGDLSVDDVFRIAFVQ